MSTVFTKNRERLIEHDAFVELFNEVLAMGNKNEWLSGEHFKGESPNNDTNESTTDADARLYRKGNTARELRFMGPTLSNNGMGLLAAPWSPQQTAVLSVKRPR